MAVSEIGGCNLSSADKLISGMTSLQLNMNKRKRGRRNKDVMSQQHEPEEPVRQQPARMVKHTDKGVLGAVALS